MSARLLKYQAYFLHEGLLAATLDEAAQSALSAEVKRRSAIAFSREAALVAAYEHLIIRLAREADELALAAAAGTVESHQLVTLTQNLYVKRQNAERGLFHAGLDIDRTVEVRGEFSTDRLLFTTGKSEIWGHKRLTILGFVDEASKERESSTIAVRPAFIGRRILAVGSSEFPEVSRTLAPWEIDQFSAIRGLSGSPSL